MKNMKKILVMTLAALLLVAVSVAGTVAYLTASSGPVENKFTPSNVGVEIDETVDNTFKMLPGVTMAKDPKVTVTNDIDAYVFVTVEENNWPENDLLTYEVDTSIWTELEDGVYYRMVAADADPKEFNVLVGHDCEAVNCEDENCKLKDGQVVVSADMDKAYMDTLNDEAKYPTLTFNAYVIQKDPFTSAAAAWAEAK